MSRQYGVTLVELVAVMVILGAVVAVSSVGIREYVLGYTEAAKRAEVVDMADSALRRVSRDIQRALPNSCRTPAGQSTSDGSTTKHLELLLTRVGGQYRTANDGGLDPLQTGVEDSSFHALGALSSTGAEAIDTATDIVVTYNVGGPAGTSNNAYNHNDGTICGTGAGFTSCNSRAISSVDYSGASTRITLTANRIFPTLPIGTQPRFSVVSGPITYRCTAGETNGTGTGQLTRQSGYSISTTQQTPPTGGTTALLAENVTSCILACADATTGGTGSAWLLLELKRRGQLARLYHAVQIYNSF